MVGQHGAGASGERLGLLATRTDQRHHAARAGGAGLVHLATAGVREAEAAFERDGPAEHHRGVEAGGVAGDEVNALVELGGAPFGNGPADEVGLEAGGPPELDFSLARFVEAELPEVNARDH